MNRWTWAGLGLACLACCLPLIIPFLGVAGVAGLGGWAGGLNWTEIACVAVLAGAVLAAVIFWLRRRRADGAQCEVRE